MGLFGKKGADAPVQNDDNKASASKKNKKNELLRCLDESVWESVLADLKANKKFIMTDDEGNKRFVAVLFDTKSVGGLVGKEAKRDESKGSALEAIRTSRIKSYIRNEMLLDESFVIIPDANTLDSMDEFMFFKDAKFILCTIDSEGNIRTETKAGTDADDDPEIELTFSEIKKMAVDDTMQVEEWFASQKEAAAAETKEDETSKFDDIPPVADDDEDIPELPDEEDDFSDIAGAKAETPAAAAATPVTSTAADDDDSIDVEEVKPAAKPAPAAEASGDSYPSEGYGDSYEDSYDDTDEGGYDEYNDITAEDLDNFVVRHFYSSDLGLEVSTEPFDAQFVHDNQYIPFNTNRGTGWLNEYLDNMSRDANTRMERMRQEHIYSLRTQYMNSIQDACAKIEKTLSTEDDETQFGKMKFAIERSRQVNMENIDTSIQVKKEQLEESWQNKLQQVGAEASAAAIQQYIDRYGKGHDSDVFNLESREKDEIERDYQNSMRRLNEDRRIEASKMLDAAVNETLSVLTQVYLEMMQAEKVEYLRLQNEMTRFVDEHRKDEKARIEALAENNRQVKQANEVRKEYAAKIKTMSAEFDMRKVALQADIEAMQRKHDDEIALAEKKYAEEVANYKSEIEQLKSELQKAKDDYVNLHDTMDSQYGKQMDDLKNELELREDNMGHVVDTHKKTLLIMTFLIIAAAVAALGVGYILGTWISVNTKSRYEQENAYYHTYTNDGTPASDVVESSETEATTETTTGTTTSTSESSEGSVVVDMTEETTTSETTN